jgi:hypothetical protein
MTEATAREVAQDQAARDARAAERAARGPKNVGLSAEGQHLINSLEAHFAAVKRLYDTGGASEGVVKHADAAFAEVLKRLDAWGLEFAAELEGVDRPADSELRQPVGDFERAGNFPPNEVVRGPSVTGGPTLADRERAERAARAAPFPAP